MIRTGAPDAAHALNREIPVPPVADPSAEKDYFEHNAPPAYLPLLQAQVQKFVAKHSGNRRIAIITSGGTTVPLENNTVRFIDNFSAGTRGATSAEQFLENDYAVIFLHREFSLQPYSRHFSHSKNCFLDFMHESESGQVVVQPAYQASMLEVLRKYKHVRDQDTLLSIPFTTVNQYLYTLRMLALDVKFDHSSQVLFYLAAAVSDFFLPASRMSEHKIQSKGMGKLIIDLDPVPKFLKRLVQNWIPGAVVVSFKLETDKEILLSKAREALSRYGHQLVIGNLLQNRKNEVVFVTPSSVQKVELSPEQIKAQVEIESLIVPDVISIHSSWISVSAESRQTSPGPNPVVAPEAV